MKNKNTDYSLYLITDRNIIGNRDFYKCIEEAILGGVTLIQLREKCLSTLEFYKTAKKAKKLTAKYKIPLIINDRLDIALAANADGLHIGQDDMPLSIARKILGMEKIIGVSATNLDEALKAQAEGADYIGVGAMYPTSTKKDAKYLSIEELKKIKASINIPVVAIGGINKTNAKEVINTGVDGISIISAILGKNNIRKATENLAKIISL